MFEGPPAPGWGKVTYRFDRERGTLTVSRSRLLRRRDERELELSRIAGLMLQQQDGERTLELVLDEGEPLVVARERDAGRAGLDRLAARVSALLGRPVELAQGVLLLGRFEIERRVERLGAATVYYAEDRETRTPVQLTLLPVPPGAGDFDERFERELSVLGGLRHAGVRRPIAHGRTPDGQRFFATPWVDGDALGELLARGAISLGDALRVVTQAVEAVAALHELGVVHGHLRAGAWRIAGPGERPILVDLGVVARLEPPEPSAEGHPAPLAPRYLAPEQAAGSGALTPATDVFALGCIFYECLTGRTPFHAPRLTGLLARIAIDGPEPVGAYRSGVPTAWTRLLARTLAKAARARPEDARALLEELQRLPRPDASVATSGDDSEPPPSTTSGVPSRPTLPAPLSHGAHGVSKAVGSVVVLVVPSSSEAPSARIEQASELLAKLGASLSRLADGALLARIELRLGAREPLAVAAGLALLLAGELPRARIAIAASERREPRIGEVVDRAEELVRRSPELPGIRLDALSAAELGPRFEQSVRADGLVLLVADVPPADPSWPVLGRPTPVVGRALELAALEACVRGALDDGTPEVAWVLGPLGSGKTRLAHELLARVKARGGEVLVISGRAEPVRGRSPYALLGGALAQHIGLGRAHDASAARLLVEQLTEHVDGARRRHTTELLGELLGVPFSDEHSVALRAARRDPRLMREQVAQAFCAWLAAECALHPVLFVLDDVHEGDRPSLELLERVREDLTAGASCVLLFGEPAVEQLFARSPSSWSLTLGPLPRAACERWARDVLDGLSAEQARQIAARAAGDPLYCEELLRAQARERRLVAADHEALRAARLARLEATPRRVLALGCVLGARFSRAWLLAAGAGSLADVDAALAALVDSELVLRPVSASADDPEYVVRHVSLVSAAERSLGAEERRAAHASAARFCAEVGAADAAVVAHHAELAGDTERALRAWLRAALCSLVHHDAAEALARAERGQRLGAGGDAFGTLLAVEAAACRSLGRFERALEAGLEALALVPAGSELWCTLAAELFRVELQGPEAERLERLAVELFTLPAPEAPLAYVQALGALWSRSVLRAEHERAQACAQLIERFEPRLDAEDLALRADLASWRAEHACLLEGDLPSARALASQAELDFAAARAVHALVRARCLSAFVEWGLGLSEQAEASAREARALALGSHDEEHTKIAEWFLGLVLSERGDAAALLEAETCARSVAALGHGPFAAASGVIAARAALGRGEPEVARREAARARAALEHLPPYAALACATELEALRQRGRAEAAAALAEEALARLEALGGPLGTEVALRVAAAEALDENQRRARAGEALAAALAVIERQSARIDDEGVRRAYRERRREVRRALELARWWQGRDG